MLFEINRKVLHPNGVALAISDNKEGTISAELWDSRHDDEGWIYADTALEKGLEKLNSYMEQTGADIQKRRKEFTGFIIQGE